MVRCAAFLILLSVQEKPAKPPVRLPDVREIQDLSLGYVLKIPRAWEPGPGGPGILHTYVGADPGPAGMTLVLNKPLAGFLEGKKTWDDVLAAWAVLMKDKVQEYTLIRKEERACGKAPGLVFVTSHKEGGDEMGALNYMVATPQGMYQLTWAAQVPVFARLEATFDALSAEFRLVDPASIKPRPIAPAPPAIVVGKPVESKVALAGPKRPALDAVVLRLELEGTSIQPTVRISSDGRFLFALDNKGVLRKISVPACTEELRIALPPSATSLQRSKAGLVIVVPEAQQAWLVDEGTLAVKSRIDVPRIVELAASPAIATAYARTQTSELSILDLQKGSVAKVLKAREVWEAAQAKVKKPKDPKEYPGLQDFQAPAVSPDGKWFFCLSGGLVRFAIKGSDLVCEEIGPRVQGGAPPRLEISADSALVAPFPCEGRTAREGHPPIGERGLYIYKVSDLQKPASALPLPSLPSSLAWDAVTKKLYVHDHVFPLVAYGPAGAKETEYPLWAGSGQTRQIVVHPEGKKLAVLTSQKLLWVELGAAGEAPKGTPLSRSSSADSGYAITAATLEKPGERFKVLPTLELSGNGRFAYALDDQGTLRKIHVPEFIEVARAELGPGCVRVLRTKAGLLVHARKSKELLVLNESTLAVAARIPAEGDHLAGSPALSLAYLTRGTDLLVIDLEKKSVLKTWTPPDLWKPMLSDETGAPFEYQAIGASPDGRTLIAIHNARLSAFAIQGSDLTFQAMGPKVAKHAIALVYFSADSKFAGSGLAAAAGAPDHPALGPGGGAYLYALPELKKPAVTVPCDSDPWTVGMDVKTGTVYCGTFNVHLGVFSRTGEKQKELRRFLTGRAEQLLVHPDGSLLLLCQNRLYWVEPL